MRFPSLTLLAPLAGALPLSGCLITIGGPASVRSSFVVDGVELEEKHVETLEIEAWDPRGLAIAACTGHMSVVHTDGPNEVVVTLHEATAGDAALRYEDGEIIAWTRSGEPHAIGDVLVRLSSAPEKLRLSTGAGEIEVDWCGTAREVHLKSGVGDISVSDAERLEVLAIETGLGSVRVEHVSCAELRASTGMGDVDVRACQAESAALESNLGDVVAHGSTFGKLEATTGMGDVSCRDSTLGEGHLESGLGDVDGL